MLINPRGPMATRRVIAHRVVLAAAALTTFVTAIVAAALAVFAGQALPLAVRHDIVRARGTAMSVSALVADPSRATPDSGWLRSRIAAALPSLPFSFEQSFWSNPLALVPALRALPAANGTVLFQAAAMSQIASHADLVSGQWPTSSPAASALPGSGRMPSIPAAMPASVAELFHVRVGDVLRLRDRVTDAIVSLDISGIYTPNRGGGSYWALSYIPVSGMSSTSGVTTYGPLVVSQASFGPRLAMASGAWLAQPDMAAIGGGLSPIAASVSALSHSLPNSSFLPSAQLVTRLPSVLIGAERDLAAARSVLVISALELLGLASVALLAVARLLATQREGEIALLIGRGATRSQLMRLTAAEVVPLSIVMSAGGGIAGIRLAGLLTSAGPMGAAGIRLADNANAYLDALVAVAVVAVVTVAALLVPLLSPDAAQVRRGRAAVVAGLTRAGLDIALVVLAGLIGWQLRQYSAVSSGGAAAIDPVIVLAPALALAAGSVAALRLLPLAALAIDRLAARGRRLPTALGGWQLSRTPVRQGSAALLLIMAVATGTLVLAQHASWNRSAADQGAFAAGGDVNVELTAPLSAPAVGVLAGTRGVTHAMAVAVDEQSGLGELLALDSAQASHVARLRGDQSRLAPSSLFRAISPPGILSGDLLPAPQPGASPGTIRVTATLAPVVPMRWPDVSALAAKFGPLTVTLTILDRAGDAYQVRAGTVVANGRPRVLVASLGGTTELYPLRVAAITAAYTMPLHSAPEMALTLSGLPMARWASDASSVAMTDVQAAGALPVAGAPRVTGQAATFPFHPGYGSTFNATSTPVQLPGQLTLLPPTAPVTAIPAIATQTFLHANDLVTGAVVPVNVNGAKVRLRIVAVVAAFPSVTATDGALVTDLGSLQEYLARQSALPLPVTQWWLATADGSVPAGLATRIPAGTAITSAARLARTTLADPLSAAPQLILVAMAAATALLAFTGFCVSIAADVRHRRAETALLTALGVTPREAALQLCLEKMMLGLPAASVGVLLGTLIARLLVPAVTLTPAATLPIPPAVTLYDLPQAVVLALAVTVLPAVAAAIGVARRPDPAATLRAAQTA